MKNQYFGDEHDFLKFCILRAFLSVGLSVFVDWMLTPNDGSRDGRRIGYLSNRQSRLCDEALFDWLIEWSQAGGVKRVALIEESGLLQGTCFFGEHVPQQARERLRRFENMRRRAAGRDVVFLDPDNGLEVSSVAPGSKKSPKYVSWPELIQLHQDRFSVLLYQHIPRFVKRYTFASDTCHAVADRLRNATVGAILAGDVIFVIAGRLDHDKPIKTALAEVQHRWSSQISLVEF